MTDCEQMPARPTEQLMQAWIHQSYWALEEALLLALGTSPDADDASETLQSHEALLARAKRSGKRFGAPADWLWWAERNNIPFHTDSWLAITPKGPIGRAVDGHRYDPTQLRSDVPKQIADKSVELGCALSQQTVRNLLKQASEEHVNRGYWDS
ncbi:MAG: hypothetical protein VX201_17545 [Pseudomonadota bacterium]|jgi:hypothetical protein|nr:hypothetical protein [Pseudomonadota bacterium]